jgi:hypothetical protein
MKFTYFTETGTTAISYIMAPFSALRQLAEGLTEGGRKLLARVTLADLAGPADGEH